MPPSNRANAKGPPSPAIVSLRMYMRARKVPPQARLDLLTGRLRALGAVDAEGGWLLGYAFAFGQM